MGGSPGVGPGFRFTGQHAEVDQHVVQTVLRQPMHRGRDRLAASHLGRDHDLALPLGLDRQQPAAGDVGVQERKVASPRPASRRPSAAAAAVVDQVHVAQG